MNNFIKNFQWQMKYYGIISAIIKKNAMHLVKIEVADEQEDTKRATDFIVNIKGGRVAVRIRRNTDFRDFTLRAKKASGYETELQKIRNGFGDFYLYCWTDKNERIIEYWLVDLDIVRTKKILDKKHSMIQNKDKDSDFIAISKDELVEIGAIVHEAKR